MKNTTEKSARPALTILRDDELSSASGGSSSPAGGDPNPVYTYGTSPAHGHAVPGWKPGEGPK